MKIKERQQVEADYTYWKVLEDLLGWRCSGFSYRLTATFVDRNGNTVQLRGTQRDDIYAAIVDTGR